MKNKLILVILLCLLILVPLVSAQDINGTLGGSGVVQSDWTVGYSSITGGDCYPKFDAVNIESTAGTTAFIRFDNGYRPTYGAGILNANTVPFNVTYGGVEIGNGTWGYQRNFNWAGTEIDGYQYFAFDHYNIGALTGTKSLTFNANATALWGGSSALACYYGGASGTPTGWFRHVISANSLSGVYKQNRDVTTWNTYTATYPNGLGGVSGRVNKTVNGVTYGSRVFLMDANTNTAISAENTLTTTDFTFQTNKTAVYIAVYTPFATWYNTSTLFNVVVPTPTPTPVVSPYTIDLSANYANYNEPIVGTLYYNGVAATAANTRAVDWIYRDASLPQDTDGEYTNNINYVENGNTTKHLNYGWNGTKFVGWDTSTQAFSNDKGTSLPNALNLYTLLSGSVTVQCMVYPVGGGAPSIVTHPLTVGGTGSMYNIVIHAVDWQTGSIIGGSTIAVKEKLTNTWSNVTTDDSGYRRVSYPMGTPLYIYASASGYVPDFLNYQVMGNDFVNIQLYRSGTEETNTSLSTLLVRTFERNDLGQIQPLNGVTVSLSDGQVKTSSGGTAQFTVANNTAVSIDAFKTGYVSATKRVTPNSALTTATLYLYSTSSTLVPTPFPTATPTPRPTETLRGNLTTCQQTLPAGADVMDIMQNNIACWGIDDLEGQNFTMAALIILLCAMVLGKFGKGDGAAIGAIIGFVISYARHLIPFYILIIAIALIAAYFANKFFGSK